MLCLRECLSAHLHLIEIQAIQPCGCLGLKIGINVLDVLHDIISDVIIVFKSYIYNIGLLLLFEDNTEHRHSFGRESLTCCEQLHTHYRPCNILIERHHDPLNRRCLRHCRQIFNSECSCKLTAHLLDKLRHSVSVCLYTSPVCLSYLFHKERVEELLNIIGAEYVIALFVLTSAFEDTCSQL